MLRQFRNWTQFDVVEAGNLEDGDIASGWLTGDSAASEIAGAVMRRDGPVIEGFLLAGNLGTSRIAIEDISSLSAEDRVSLAEVNGDESFDDAMRSAKFDYGAYTSAGRNNLSIVLQFRLTQVIAKQRGGIWTDPICGDYLVVAKGQWQRLPCLVAYDGESTIAAATQSGVRSKAWWKFW